MSTGGLFTIITNDGRQDKLLMATEFLSGRISDIKKAKENMVDSNPTLADIEKTHANYLTAHYRPYVALASNYTSVKSSGGVSSITSSASNVITFTFPIYGTFTSDMVLHVQLGALGSLTAGASDPLYRWCAKPGLRFVQRVQFISDSKVIDEYTVDNMLFVDKFDIPFVTTWTAADIFPTDNYIRVIKHILKELYDIDAKSKKIINYIMNNKYKTNWDDLFEYLYKKLSKK